MLLQNTEFVRKATQHHKHEHIKTYISGQGGVYRRQANTFNTYMIFWNPETLPRKMYVFRNLWASCCHRIVSAQDWTFSAQDWIRNNCWPNMDSSLLTNAPGMPSPPADRCMSHVLTHRRMHSCIPPPTEAWHICLHIDACTRAFSTEFARQQDSHTAIREACVGDDVQDQLRLDQLQTVICIPLAVALLFRYGHLPPARYD